MTDILNAINTLNVESVRHYFETGGTLNVKTDKGFDLFPYVVMEFLKPDPVIDEEAEDTFAPNAGLAGMFGGTLNGQNVPTVEDDGTLDDPLAGYSQSKRNLFEIGCVLLENGADYSARLGKTNRSIQIDKRIESSHLSVHQVWKAKALRYKLLTESEKSAPEKETVKKQRKL